MKRIVLILVGIVVAYAAVSQGLNKGSMIQDSMKNSNATLEVDIPPIIDIPETPISN